jgi:hypothetical protein
MAGKDKHFRTGASVGEEPGQHVAPDAAPPTGGDMLKSVYDPTDSGKVNSAISADQAGTAVTADEATKVSGFEGAGVNYYYGTDLVGTLGYHPFPSVDEGEITTSFVGLIDTPANYIGSAGLLVQVNGNGDGLVFTSKAPAATVSDRVVGSTAAPAGYYYGTDDNNNVGFHKLPDPGTLPPPIVEGDDKHARLLIWQGI